MAGDYTAWASSIDQAIFGGLNDFVGSLPKPLVVLVALASVFGLLVFSRLVVQMTATKAPPVFEGVPFIGGILKFAKVRPDQPASVSCIQGLG